MSWWAGSASGGSCASPAKQRRKSMWGKVLGGIGLCSLLAVGCSESTGPLAPCTAGAPLVNLTAGEYRSADPRPRGDFVLRTVRGPGCVAFAANQSGSDIEYLLVPQAATGTPGGKSSFLLRGATLAASSAPAPAPIAPSVQLAPAARFHQFLRESEQQLYLSNPPTIHAFTAPRVALGPPAVGDVGTFSVCSNLDCTSKTTVTATAKQVGMHIAIFVDNNAPPNGLSDADLLSLRLKFDTLLYVRDTLAFGGETDIDGNTVVIVLMTNAVNQLVSAAECSATGFVAGYFYGADLIFGQGNNGEIFYSIVADPSGTLMSCPHSVTQVNSLVPVTFIHEFQHMISFGQHYLRRAGAPEVLWLNEGLSHFAEEMGGRRYLPDTATFCDFVNGDLHNAGQYFSAPQDHYLLATERIGTLAERSAMWLFVRYLVDQYAADQSLTAGDVVTRQLDQTTLTGAANVEHVTGRPFAETVTHWALANYVSDLPGFTALPELQYKVRKFRTDYPTLSARCPVPNNIPATFPLVPPVGPGEAVSLSDTLRAGSGLYFRAQQSAGAIGFTLLFSDGRGFALPDALAPRLNVIRIKRCELRRGRAF